MEINYQISQRNLATDHPNWVKFNEKVKIEGYSKIKSVFFSFLAFLVSVGYVPKLELENPILLHVQAGVFNNWRLCFLLNAFSHKSVGKVEKRFSE